MIASESSSITKLIDELGQLSKQNASGELSISSHGIVVTMYLQGGRLLYVRENVHPVRRWQRVLKQHAPTWDSTPSQTSEGESWEHQLLHQGVSEKKISLTQSKTIIHSAAKESLCEVCNYEDLKIDWKPKPKTESVLSAVVSLSSIEVQMILKEVVKNKQVWQDAGLGNIKPVLAPLLKAGAPISSPPEWFKYLNGKYSLWDIAVEMKKPISEVTKAILPLFSKGLLHFRELPDLSVTIQAKTTAPINTTIASGEETISRRIAAREAAIPSTTESKSTPSGRGKALIACIDDSPVVAHNLKKILTPAGYEILVIPEPMHGFSQLLDNKPDLILLDINMPNANGYSVCQFLRNSPVFEKTPIIILTGQDTSIDRARAKLVGATDFMGKSAEPPELLGVVEKYLKK